MISVIGGKVCLAATRVVPAATTSAPKTKNRSLQRIRLANTHHSSVSPSAISGVNM